MKKTKKAFMIFALVMLIVLAITGCAGMTVRAENNLSSVRTGGSLRFSASGKDIQWNVSSTPDGIGGVESGTFITNNGVLTIAPNETALILYITARNEKGNTDIKAIRIVAVTGVTVTAASHSVKVGGTLQCAASVTGINDPDSRVTWKVSADADGVGAGSSGTKISNSGMLTVGAGETNTTLYIIATSTVDPSKSGSVSVSVLTPTITALQVNPPTQTVIRGNTSQFSAVVVAGTHDPDPTVTWAVSANPAGTGAVTQGTSITGSGLLTIAANEAATTLFVIATSVYDPSKTSFSIVTVANP